MPQLWYCFQFEFAILLTNSNSNTKQGYFRTELKRFCACENSYAAMHTLSIHSTACAENFFGRLTMVVTQQKDS